jgi:hypothetical protein
VDDLVDAEVIDLGDCAVELDARRIRARNRASPTFTRPFEDAPLAHIEATIFIAQPLKALEWLAGDDIGVARAVAPVGMR